MSPEAMIRKIWNYPVLRKSIPHLLDQNRLKWFALRDKTQAQRARYFAMVDEYNKLLALEASEAKEATDGNDRTV